MDQDDETSIRRGTYYGTYDEQVAKALRERHRTASTLGKLNSGSSGVGGGRRKSTTVQDGRSEALRRRWGSMTKNKITSPEQSTAKSKSNDAEDEDETKRKSLASASQNAMTAVYDQTFRRFNVIESWADNCDPSETSQIYEVVEKARIALQKCKTAIGNENPNVESLLLMATIQVNKASSVIRNAGIKDSTKYATEIRGVHSTKKDDLKNKKPPTPKAGSPKLTRQTFEKDNVTTTTNTATTVDKSKANPSSSATFYGEKESLYNNYIKVVKEEKRKNRSPMMTSGTQKSSKKVFTTPKVANGKKKVGIHTSRPLWALDLAVILEHTNEEIAAVVEALPALSTTKYSRKHLRNLSYEQQCLITETIMSYNDNYADVDVDEDMNNSNYYDVSEKDISRLDVNSPQREKGGRSPNTSSPNIRIEVSSPNGNTSKPRVYDHASHLEGSYRDSWAHSRRALNAEDHAEHAYLRTQYLDKLHDQYEPFHKWSDNHSKNLGRERANNKNNNWNNLYFKGTPKNAPIGAVSEQRKKGVKIEHTTSTSYGGRSPRHHHNKSPTKQKTSSPTSKVDDHMSAETMKKTRGRYNNYVRKNMRNGDSDGRTASRNGRSPRRRQSPVKTKKQVYHEHIENERLRNITHNEPYCEKNSPHGLSASNWITSLGSRTAGHKHRFVVKKGHAEQEAKRIAARESRRRGSIAGMHKHIHIPESRHHAHVFESHHYH